MQSLCPILDLRMSTIILLKYTLHIESDQEKWIFIYNNKKTYIEQKKFFITSNYATLLDNEYDLDTILAERTKPKPNISVNGL